MKKRRYNFILSRKYTLEKGGKLEMELNDNIEEVIYNLRTSCKNSANNEVVKGFGVVIEV